MTNCVDSFSHLYIVPFTLTLNVSLTPTSSTVDVGSSVTLTCTPSLLDASQYNGANIIFDYQHNVDSGVHVFIWSVHKKISSGIVPNDSIAVEVDTSSAGIYTCTVTINGLDVSSITGMNSASGQSMAQITAQSKLLYTVVNITS